MTLIKKVIFAVIAIVVLAAGLPMVVGAETGLLGIEQLFTRTSVAGYHTEFAPLVYAIAAFTTIGGTFYFLYGAGKQIPLARDLFSVAQNMGMGGRKKGRGRR